MLSIIILEQAQKKIMEVRKYFDGRFVLKMNDKADSKIISGSTYTKQVREIFEI